MLSNTRTLRIAEANDNFRTTMISGPRNRVVFTEAAHDYARREELVTAIRAYSNFGADLDPYGEHDFGKVRIGQDEFYWKIDYYDAEFEYGLDPYEEESVCRLLTVMYAHER